MHVVDSNYVVGGRTKGLGSCDGCDFVRENFKKLPFCKFLG